MAPIKKVSSVQGGEKSVGVLAPKKVVAPTGSATVKALQTSLNLKGANLKVDGIQGPLTNAAIAKYGGSSSAPKITSGSYTVPGTNVPLRNDLQAAGGAGYKEVSRLSSLGNVSPESSQASSTNLASNTPNIPTSNIVNTQTLNAQNQKLTFPELTPTPIPTIPPITLDTQIADEQKKQATDFQTYLDALTAPPSAADSYKKAQKETGILQKQKAVNDLTASLNQIVSTGQAQQLSLTGQGRGIPEAIIGGQQAEIGRQTAINALPVQAQLSAAQGNLDMAEQNLSTLFKIYSDDATNKYNYKTKVNEAVYQFADKQSQAKIANLQKKQDREYTQSIADLKARQDIALEATKNGASASVILAITSAPDFASAIKAAGSSLVTFSKELTEVNGRKALVDKRTGVVQYLDGKGSDIVVRTVNGTPVEGYKLIAGDDPYFIAQKYGIDINSLKGLNPKISDWNNIQPGVIINVPSKNAGQNQALQTILGSGKFTKEQKADLTDAINNGQDPFTVIKNQAKNVMGQTLATSLDKYETAKEQLKTIDSMLSNYYSKGGKTGIFTGNFEKTINKLGEISSPELVEISTNIASALQIYRNAVSGTAYSVQEGKDIASIFPGINKTEGLNKAILSGRTKAFDTTIDAQYRNTLGSAYDDLKANSKPPVEPLQNVISYGDSHPEVRGTIIQMQADGLTIEAISNWINQRQ